jgi:hypothetical protein
MKRPIFKKEAHNKTYLEKGFICENLLNSDEVQSTLNQLLALKPDDNYAPNRPGVSNYHCTFLDTNESYKRATNRLFKELFNPLIEKLFVDYHVWNANFYVKPPGAGKFEIHQNWTHVKDESTTSFTIWCPLVDTTITNGTIMLVKGSHKILPDIATMDVPYYFADFEPLLLSDYLEPIPCKAGDCVIFEDGVIHFSDKNLSDSPRYALQILIGPKEEKPVYYYYNEKQPDLGFEMFEITDDFFMKNSYLTFKNRPDSQQSIGFVSNNNKKITVEEFKTALINGDNRRRALYGE